LAFRLLRIRHEWLFIGARTLDITTCAWRSLKYAARREASVRQGSLLKRGPAPLRFTLFTMAKPRASDGVDLGWVDKAAPVATPTGTAFGVPWAQGEIDKTTPISVTVDGEGIPVQTWPLA
jgi:hypothetical protein